MDNDYSGDNWVTCHMCKGSGFEHKYLQQPCYFCRTTGKIKTKLLDGITTFLCPDCGWSTTRVSSCKTCDSTGIVDWIQVAQGVMKRNDQI